MPSHASPPHKISFRRTASGPLAREVKPQRISTSSVSWSIDRWGRLIAGASVLFFTMMSALFSYQWAWGLCAASSGLLLSALTDRCPIHWLLLRLGAREREDIFGPGGIPKPNQCPSVPLKENTSHENA